MTTSFITSNSTCHANVLIELKEEVMAEERFITLHDVVLSVANGIALGVTVLILGECDG